MVGCRGAPHGLEHCGGHSSLEGPAVSSSCEAARSGGIFVTGETMTVIDAAALVLRLILGLTMIAHGYNHVWGGGGLDGTTRWFGSLGLRQARMHAVLSGAGEIAAGAGLVAGLLTSLSAAFVVGTMVVAGVTVHYRNGFFVFKEGYEYVLMIAVVCTVVALLGPGAISVDRLIGVDGLFDGGIGVLGAVGLGVGGAAILLAATWRPAGQDTRA